MSPAERRAPALPAPAAVPVVPASVPVSRSKRPQAVVEHAPLPPSRPAKQPKGSEPVFPQDTPGASSSSSIPLPASAGPPVLPLAGGETSAPAPAPVPAPPTVPDTDSDLEEAGGSSVASTALYPEHPFQEELFVLEDDSSWCHLSGSSYVC